MPIMPYNLIAIYRRNLTDLFFNVSIFISNQSLLRDSKFNKMSLWANPDRLYW